MTTTNATSALEACEQLNASDPLDGVQAFNDGKRHFTESDAPGRLEMLRDANLGLMEMERHPDASGLPAATAIDAAYWGGVLVAAREVLA